MKGSFDDIKRLNSFTEGGLILLCGALAIGSAASYLVFGVVSAVVAAMCVVSEECRSSVRSYFQEAKWIWILVLLFLIVSVTVSLLSPMSKLAGLGELKWVFIWVALLVPVAALHRPHGTERVSRWIAWFVVVLIVISAIDGVAQVFTQRNILRELMGSRLEFPSSRASGFLRNPVQFGHLMGCLFWMAAVGVHFARAEKNRPAFWMAAVVVLASFGGVLMSQSRGSWLAMVAVGAFSLFLLKGHARRGWMGVVGAATLAGVTALVASDSIRDRMVSAFDPKELANRLRLELWEANFAILREHPWGVGFRSNQEILLVKFEELGIEPFKEMYRAHNEFIDIAVASGWLGVALYLAFSAWLFVRVVVASRAAPISAKHQWSHFLLYSSALLQVFVHVGALTAHIGTVERFFLCIAWAIAIVVPIDLAREKMGAAVGST